MKESNIKNNELGSSEVHLLRTLITLDHSSKYQGVLLNDNFILNVHLPTCHPEQQIYNNFNFRHLGII